MINKHNLAVVEFVSKEESRYNCKGILVTPDATVATNGRYLAWVSTARMQAANFPAVEGFSGGQDQFPPFLLDADTAKALAKALPKKTKIPVLQYAAVNVEEETRTDANGENREGTGKAKAVSLCTTDLERPQVFRPRIPEGQFPNYEAVIPKVEDTFFEVSVNPEYLATIAKAFAQFQKDKERPVVRMRFQQHSTPGEPGMANAIRFDATNDSQGMTVVLMPIRDDGDQFGTYGYAEREAKREAEREAAKQAEANAKLAEAESKTE